MFRPSPGMMMMMMILVSTVISPSLHIYVYRDAEKKRNLQEAGGDHAGHHGGHDGGHHGGKHWLFSPFFLDDSSSPSIIIMYHDLGLDFIIINAFFSFFLSS